MKRVISAFVLIFAFLFLGYVIFDKKNTVMGCNAVWHESRPIEPKMTLLSHISVLVNAADLTGIISVNGNIYNEVDNYKLKRNVEFELKKIDNYYKLVNVRELITKEDDTPNKLSKYFYFLNADFSFAGFTFSVNNDGSFVFYNTHEPVLVCGQ